MKNFFYLMFLYTIILVGLCGCNKTIYETQKENKKAICRSNQAIIKLNNNGKMTTVEEKRKAEGTYFSDEICNSIKKIAYSYDKNATVTCKEKEFYANYSRNDNIESIINGYSDNYHCVLYGNDTKENKNIIVGSWCLEFDNNGDKNIYKYTYNEDGTYTEYKEFGENGKYKTNTEGVYTFDGNVVKAISLIGNGSGYDEYISYDKETNTLKNSNIRSEFPNTLKKCN